MPRFYSLVENIFVVLLLPRSYSLPAKYLWCLKYLFVVLAVDSRVPLSLLDPHGLAFFGPCLPARSDFWLLELG